VVLSDLQVTKAKTILTDQRKSITALTQKLTNCTTGIARKQITLDNFQKEIDDCYIQKSRATMLIDALLAEKNK
jgi:hypothetical protein